MKNKCPLVVALGVLACLTLLAGCRTGAGGTLPTVKVAINTWPGLGPYYVAKAKGFDREQGIQLDVIMNEDTVARHTSLAAGEVDLVGITLDSVVIARSRGVPMTVVGQSDFSYGGDGIIASDSIKTVADLRGKRIACAEGLPSHFFLLLVMRKEGMGPKDFTLVPADDGSQAAQLFTSGRVDAAVTWDPWISKAESLTSGHVLITTRETPGTLLGIVAANSDLLPQRRDGILRAQKAWLKAVDFCRDHPDEAAAIMAKEFNVPVEEFKRMANGAKLADLTEELRTFGTAESPGPVVQLARDANEVWLQAGAIKQPVDPRQVIDWTIVDELRKAGN
ncbi:MAG TPA: ABC transporter substrate-binding protein [Pyrinomonadaceae bacterium]|jgi:NitT/TauT family transport system substrate-binding protein|nr:ABC transporter substrate-binding protein [Pyrinomonadaceae bacterium]